MLLVGLGLDELSVSPVILPEIKMLIRSMGLEEARRLAAEVLAMSGMDEITNHCRRLMSERFPQFPIWMGALPADPPVPAV